jgi:hypothetical protein
MLRLLRVLLAIITKIITKLPHRYEERRSHRGGSAWANHYRILTCTLKGIKEISQGVGWVLCSGLEGANMKVDMRGLAGLGGSRPKIN